MCSQAVDTVLVKLLAASDKIDALEALIDEPNHIVLSEIEPVLKSASRYGALCKLYRRCGDESKLLESWSK